MFGKVTLTPVDEVSREEPLESAVAKLLAITDGAEIARWVQFRAGLLVFVVVPGDPESGGIYVLDRKAGTWYFVDFEDDKYGGYSEADFDYLMRECRFARLVEQPRLLESCRWQVAPGVGPELLGAVPRQRQEQHRKLNVRFNLTSSAVQA